MVPLTALWLPILLSAVVVFIASSIMHMVLPYHRRDYKGLPDEDQLLAALRTAGVSRGVYMFPFCSHKDMKSPATVEKQKLGPVGTLTVFPTGPINMPKYLAMWLVYCVLIGIFVAYLTGRTVSPGAPYLAVLRVAGTAAFLAYGVGQLSNGIWTGQPWSLTVKHVIDGLVYSVLVGAVFGWLWAR